MENLALLSTLILFGRCCLCNDIRYDWWGSRAGSRVQFTKNPTAERKSIELARVILFSCLSANLLSLQNSPGHSLFSFRFVFDTNLCVPHFNAHLLCGRWRMCIQLTLRISHKKEWITKYRVAEYKVAALQLIEFAMRAAACGSIAKISWHGTKKHRRSWFHCNQFILMWRISGFSCRQTVWWSEKDLWLNFAADFGIKI